MKADATVISVNTSPGGIPKLSLSRVRLLEGGLEGDGHDHAKHDTPQQAVSIQDIEVLRELAGEGFAVSAGSTGENLTVAGLGVNQLPVGTVLSLVDGPVMELTKVRKPCFVLDQIDPRLQEAIRGRCGMYARVLQPGALAPGQSIEVRLPAARSGAVSPKP